MTARNTDRAPSAADHKPSPRPEAEKATEAEVAAALALLRQAGVSAPKAEPKVSRQADRPCACGCGGLTRRRFVPGHDTRVGPRAEGKKAGQAAATRLVSGEATSVTVPADLSDNDKARWLAGFGSAVAEAGRAWA